MLIFNRSESNKPNKLETYMKPELQRIKIAEACGWKNCFLDATKTPFGREPNSPYVRMLPDYLSDLNAMHEAEKVLDASQRNRYAAELGRSYDGSFQHVTATASQRAEAFLRTLGKWEEGT